MGRAPGHASWLISASRFKKVLNVDSPSFTPASLAVPAKLTAISQAVNATPFTPRGLSSGRCEACDLILTDDCRHDNTKLPT